MTNILEIAKELDMETMYNLISKAVVNDSSLEEDALMITNGRNDVHIAYYIDSNHQEQIAKKGNKIIIKGNPQLIFTITQWFEEKQYRKALMLQFIEKHIEEYDITEGR